MATPEEDNIEREKLEIEKRRLDLQEKLHNQEISLKRKEHQSISTPQATVAGAAIALFSGLFGAIISSSSNENISETNAASALEIERTKVEGSLALEETKQKAAERLADLGSGPIDYPLVA